MKKKKEKPSRRNVVVVVVASQLVGSKQDVFVVYEAGEGREIGKLNERGR